MTNSESFFDELKTQRESQNIEISEICEFTKIQKKYIIAMESGDFNMLPNVYTRLFLKAYANFIGADSKKALNDYELYTTGKITKKYFFNENKDKSSSEQKKLPDTVISEGQISSKQILSGIFVIFIIIAFLWWTSKLTNEQTIKMNPTSKQETSSIQVDINSTNISDSTLKIDSINVVAQTFLLNDLPLNENDFLINKKDSEITKSLQLNPPYKISIEIINDTKINISNTNNSKTTSLINRIVKKGDKFEFDFLSIINFEFLDSNDIMLKLNDSSINEFLKVKSLAIRGSYEASNSQLYISFYNY